MPRSFRSTVVVALAAALAPLARALHAEPRYAANISGNSTRNYKFGAIYFGDWHVDPVMSALHGPDWTEFEVVTHALPRYEGHQQPNLPKEDPGFGKRAPEDVPANMEIKIQAAKAAGVDYFLFDWCVRETRAPTTQTQGRPCSCPPLLAMFRIARSHTLLVAASVLGCPHQPNTLLVHTAGWMRWVGGTGTSCGCFVLSEIAAGTAAWMGGLGGWMGGWVGGWWVGGWVGSARTHVRTCVRA
jgi:hypothetical protein